ncbi:hypothetical protein [Fredinandcohnia quinoae]|uniref:Uncharacterized protein n=1 Tax=Fredinandcohnia quinoae TaxID=2918902 RepID=A0AAW5E3W9_9BACI|nr:hypothetical protein [Fredinandcohnia sp. SECRCQ15]MCH1627173.1 hypothetical protein [Fredinandcohnia sp. SECRCQ15]
MANERIPKLRSLTFTSGNIRNLAADCEQLNIRGAVALHQEVRLREISTHGHSSFHSLVVVHILKNTGACVLKDFCVIDELSNAGNLKLLHGKITKINNSGKLTIEQSLQVKQFHAIGIVKAKEIKAEQFHLKLSGRSVVEQLTADEIYVEKDKLSISLVKKKLVSKCIKGENLHLSNTNAELVEGGIVTVGDNCFIDTLYYTESYSISENAKVQHIRSKEK